MLEWLNCMASSPENWVRRASFAFEDDATWLSIVQFGRERASPSEKVDPFDARKFNTDLFARTSYGLFRPCCPIHPFVAEGASENL